MYFNEDLTHCTTQTKEFLIEDIINIFNACFQVSHNTILIKGEDEPIYLPADETHSFNRIIFANGFYASALHEIAHWCVAGPTRWNLIDFGYWYCPDGRDKETQSQFENVEIAPQSYEWIFSVAAGFPFQVSCDNLNGSFEPDHREFKKRVHAKVLERLNYPLAPRPAKLVRALQVFYQTPKITQDSFLIT
ncbi:elongation factor P hydroxylase [Thorsellia anophelis]|uniref:Elongation factor P hydroxylase n=1 Tax=Thorsellia anophelis DSM 18579 TaxID=1123402 RepID=A0A1I0BM24_9GAMM|nr:elongation factor P hydroxylase [Thorsellia anophelis]SET07339.1 hypothetical protein SAMN02583745_01294 [Thorsellia anophelis DSM 18579]